MNSVERVKSICKDRKIPISKLEKDCGFSNGYIGQLRKGVLPDDRLIKISEYLNLSVDYLMTGEKRVEMDGYYYNKETAEMAQQLFENKDLRVLFDAAKDASPEDLKTTHEMLMALKKKERGIIDD